VEYACDVIIYATGFQSTEFLTPMQVHGRAGESLNEVWKDGAEAYKGVAVPGFPNFFLLYGPNTNLGHNSIILMVEQQIWNTCSRRLNGLRLKDVAALDVKPEAMSAYNETLQADLGKTVWAGDCASWYKTERRQGDQ
jgi:cation diffusion facilitator CzcD-associated flavoprotein CzcO